MNKITVFVSIIFFLSTVLADDAEYLEKVRLEPEHGSLNYEGEIKILFDLPKDDLVEKVYLSYTQGIEEHIFSSTEVSGSKLGYLNNSLTLKGSELYELLESLRTSVNFRNITAAADTDDDDVLIDDDAEESDDDTVNDEDETYDEELPDDDSGTGTDRSWADKTYDIKLTVELDNSGNNEDNETDDSDTAPVTTTTIPEKVTKTLKITFDNTAPQSPEINDDDTVNPEGGDRRIIIYVTPPVDPDDKEERDEIGKYHATLSGLFDRDGTEVQSELKFTTEVESSSYDEEWEFSLSGKEGLELINNDSGLDKYVYTIRIYAEDIAGNSDPEKYVETAGSAVTTYGYWKNYKEKGGRDDGGFCFVATAGFGSYFHPQVKILRDFTDLVLAKFSAGRSFIKAYYEYGKMPARIIAESQFLRAVTRTLLIPFVITGWLFTTTYGQIILLMWLFLIPVFILRRKAVVLLMVIAGIFVLDPQELKGVDGEFSFNSSFYYPSKIDSEADGAFKEIGGDGLRYLPSLTFGFKVPVLENYIRWSFIGGIGYTRFKGTSVKADGEKSSDESAMHFIPLMGEMKLRPGYDFPLWPYATIGIDYYIWWIREKGETSEEGGTFGFHGSFGLMISLNWMDNSASRKLEELSGITNTSLFVHYRLEKINDFGKEKSFDLSGSRFEFGIVFEF